MKVMKLENHKPIVPLFALKVPDFVYDLYQICISNEAFEKKFKEYLNMNPKRLIKIVEAVQSDTKSVLLVVIYDNIATDGKSLLKSKLRTKVKDFNFPVFIVNMEENTNIEDEIQAFKRGGM